MCISLNVATECKWFYEGVAANAHVRWWKEDFRHWKFRWAENYFARLSVRNGMVGTITAMTYILHDNLITSKCHTLKNNGGLGTLIK